MVGIYLIVIGLALATLSIAVRFTRRNRGMVVAGILIAIGIAMDPQAVLQWVWALAPLALLVLGFWVMLVRPFLPNRNRRRDRED